VAECPSGPEQHLDGAALVHGAVALGNLRHGQLQVEDLAGVDLPVPDQVGQEAAHRGGAAEQVDFGEEYLGAGNVNLVVHADEAHVANTA